MRFQGARQAVSDHTEDFRCGVDAICKLETRLQATKGVLDGDAIIWSEEIIYGLVDHTPDPCVPGPKIPVQPIVQRKDRTDPIACSRGAAAPEEN